MINSSSRCRDVVLLSAGPGDLELLTIKAVKALATAQVLLLDDLANPQIVELAPQARVIRWASAVAAAPRRRTSSAG